MCFVCLFVCLICFLWGIGSRVEGRYGRTKKWMGLECIVSGKFTKNQYKVKKKTEPVLSDLHEQLPISIWPTSLTLPLSNTHKHERGGGRERGRASERTSCCFCGELSQIHQAISKGAHVYFRHQLWRCEPEKVHFRHSTLWHRLPFARNAQALFFRCQAC